LTEAISQAAKGLLEYALFREMLPVRLLGVEASNSVRAGSTPPSLFDADHRQRLAALDWTVDFIRSQFGTQAIRGGLLVKGPDSGEEDGAQPSPIIQ
jgi:hypothetical protein